MASTRISDLCTEYMTPYGKRWSKRRLTAPCTNRTQLRISCAEGMTQFEVAWHRDCVPDRGGRRSGFPGDGDRPLEAGLGIFPLLANAFLHNAA